MQQQLPLPPRARAAEPLSPALLARAALRSPFSIEPLLDASPAQQGRLCLLHAVRLLRNPKAHPAAQSASLLALIEDYQRGDAFALELLTLAMSPGLGAIRRHTNLPDEEIAAAFRDVVADYPIEARPSRVASNLLKETKRVLLAERKNDSAEEEIGEKLAATLATGADLGEVISAEEPLTKEQARAIFKLYVSLGYLTEDEAEFLNLCSLGVKLGRVGGRSGLTEEAVKQRKHRLKEKLAAALGREI
jgi:hypothetical protein